MTPVIHAERILIFYAGRRKIRDGFVWIWFTGCEETITDLNEIAIAIPLHEVCRMRLMGTEIEDVRELARAKFREEHPIVCDICTSLATQCVGHHGKTECEHLCDKCFSAFRTFQQRYGGSYASWHSKITFDRWMEQNGLAQQSAYSTPDPAYFKHWLFGVDKASSE